MAQNKSDSTKEDWEEVLMMVDIPTGAKTNTLKEGNLYFQALGLWSDEPVIKFDNMIYSGEIKSPLGSHLFVEIRDGDEKQSKSRSLEDRSILVADKFLKLQPIHLVKKNGVTLPTAPMPISAVCLSRQLAPAIPLGVRSTFVFANTSSSSSSKINSLPPPPSPPHPVPPSCCP